jgi:probable F420-dependent oxidoreductase
LFTSDRGITPAEAAKAAEQAGFDSFSVPEHTHMPVKREAAHPGTGDATLPDERYVRTLDPWVALATAASVTERIRLATAVALPAEHDPITLAKTVATLDHLSGGRVVLGAGFGWNSDELADHGVPPGKRRTVLREYLEGMQEIWSRKEAEYYGSHLTFGPCWSWPKPVQQPRVPIMIGAGGTQKTFDWIVRSADGWITTPGEKDIDDKVRDLQNRWREADRAADPEITVLAGRPDPDQLAHWKELGITEVTFGLPDIDAEGVIAYIGKLAAKLDIA